jgi:hypothetical protein
MSSDEAGNSGKSTFSDIPGEQPWAAQLADPSIRRDVLLGQIARARAALYAAEKAGDQKRAAELKRTTNALVAARDALG